MKPYPTYKDSGIEWIGEIPEHWGNYKISRSFKLIGSGTTPKADNEKFYNNGDINWILTGDLKDNIINESTKKITQEALDKHSTLKIYPKNTLLIAMYGATIGKVGILNIEACTNQACCALSQSDFFNIKFLYYWFVTNRNQIINLSYGGGQPNISQEIIKSLKISGPSLKEQNNIVSYLDDRVSQIDETIAKKEKLIELLEEERKAIINEAVTKGLPAEARAKAGLDPNVKLKPSGIEWLGDIPEHWEIKKIKHICNIQGRVGFKGYSKSDLVYEGEGALTLGAKHINKSFELDLSNPEYISWEKYYESPEIMVKKGDILVTQRGSLGKAVIINSDIGEATINPSMILLNRINCKPEYLITYFQSKYFSSWIDLMNSGTAVPMISQEQLSNLYFVSPPLLEQTEIANFISKQIIKLNNTEQKVKKEIELLKEYRQALIFEAVTGKIDVRDYN